jgi:hypothetical protein
MRPSPMRGDEDLPARWPAVEDLVAEGRSGHGRVLVFIRRRRKCPAARLIQARSPDVTVGWRAAITRRERVPPRLLRLSASAYRAYVSVFADFCRKTAEIGLAMRGLPSPPD